MEKRVSGIRLVDHEFHDASEVALGGQVMVHKLCAFLAVALVASVSIAQISEDERSKLEGWWYRCERPLSDDSVTRLEQRVQEDPADGEAAFYLSQVLRLGAGDRPVDLNRSMHLLQESAVMGFPAAQARLAKHKMMGQGVEYDREDAIQLFEVAMEQNEPDAFLYRGILLLNNADPTDTQLAVAEADLKRALELGAVAALFPLSHLTALRGDLESGRRLLVKGAEAGDPQAQFYLGGSYFRGRAGFPVDREKGLQWMIQAAESGEGRWQGELALLFSEELRRGRDSHRWASMAAERGDANGEYLLGVDYLTGQYSEMDIDGGLRLLHSASEKGVADAQVFLARIYLDGFLVERDVDKARQLLERAAASGQHFARVLLRWMEFSVNR